MVAGSMHDAAHSVVAGSMHDAAHNTTVIALISTKSLIVFMARCALVEETLMLSNDNMTVNPSFHRIYPFICDNIGFIYYYSCRSMVNHGIKVAVIKLVSSNPNSPR